MIRIKIKICIPDTAIPEPMAVRRVMMLVLRESCAVPWVNVSIGVSAGEAADVADIVI